MPGEYGTARPVWFVLDPRFWRGGLRALRRMASGCCQGCGCAFSCCCCCCGPKSPSEAEAAAERTRFSASTSARGDHEVSAEDEDGAVVGEGQSAVMVHQLRREFGSHVAVDDLTFNLEEGEIYALLGHNGTV